MAAALTGESRRRRRRVPAGHVYPGRVQPHAYTIGLPIHAQGKTGGSALHAGAARGAHPAHAFWAGRWRAVYAGGSGAEVWVNARAHPPDRRQSAAAPEPSTSVQTVEGLFVNFET